MTEASNDAFTRLKNRTRATVSPRTHTLINENKDKITEFSHSAIAEISQDNIPPVTQEETEAIVRRTIRLEAGLDEQIDQFCRRSKITRDTFLEAAYQVCLDNPELLKLVLAEAQQRYHRRKKIGEKRKLETLNKKYQ
jgi:hypothetical protein